MKYPTRDHLTIGDVFGLDRIPELNRVERVALPSSEDGGHVLYLFRCEDLLPKGQKLAVDECRGTVGVFREGVTLKEAAVSMMEIALLTAIILSFPFSVGESQLQGVYKLYPTDEQVPEKTDNKRFQDLITDCNERLRSLDIVILSTDAAYRLSATSEEKS